jgi:5-hydroxyisourate hydrolase-like protein (transthyretin family)
MEIDPMIRVPACIVALTLAALAQTQKPGTQPAGAGFRISGTVVNAVTGQALSRTVVSIGRATGPESVQSVTTNEDGRFQFENLRAGKYWLQAQRSGFSPQRFNQHEDFSTAIVVGPNLDSDDLIFRVVPDASITGTITDEQNEPVRTARVLLFRTGLLNGTESTRMREASTDDQGRYHLSRLRSGTFLVAVSAQPWYAEFGRARRVMTVATPNDGSVSENESSSESEEERRQSEFDVAYPVTFFPGVTDAGSATPLVVKPGDRVIADIAVNPVPALHLHISDPNIDPSQGVNVTLKQHLFGSFETQVPAQTTDIKKGELEISGVPPGQFTVSFIKFQPTGETPVGRDKNVDLSDNAQIDLSDSSGAPSISGVVRLDGGRALSQLAIVQFSNRTSNHGFRAQTSTNGEFVVRDGNVPPGRYEISVFNLPNALLKSITATGAKVTGHSVEITPGASIHLELTVSQGVGRVDGTALRDGKPFAGAMIVLVPRDIENNSTLVRRDQSDSDGTFTLQNVLPGEYTVVAIENGWDLEWLNPAVLQPYLKTGEQVTVAARQEYDVKVAVQ